MFATATNPTNPTETLTIILALISATTTILVAFITHSHRKTSRANSEKLDAIDNAVNHRPPGSTVSQDVLVIRDATERLAGGVERLTSEAVRLNGKVDGIDAKLDHHLDDHREGRA